MARKGFYEELMKKEQLKELTAKMIKHVNKIMDSENPEDESRKDNITTKILPKIIDKAIPTQLVGEGGDAIVIKVASDISNKYAEGKA